LDLNQSKDVAVKYFQPWLIGALVFLPLTSGIAADCTLKKMASFDAKLEHGQLMIQAKIDDRDVSVALDTGSPFNMIDNKLAEELKLPLNRMTIRGVDAAGHEANVSAMAHTVTLGDFTATNVSFLVGGRESANGSWVVQALFGDNLLEANDLELDLAHGKVNIFSADHCAGQGVYWAREYVPIPIRIQNFSHIYLPVTLDGLETSAMLDTGSGLTTIDKHVAEGKLNVPVDGGKDKPDGYLIAGTGTRMPYYFHKFGTFDIGGLAFHNTEFAVSPNRMNYLEMNRSNDPHVTERAEEPINAPITLGLPQMSKLRMYFSFQEHMLYVTPANAQWQPAATVSGDGR
jgi:predicted aspartyl protease